MKTNKGGAAKPYEPTELEILQATRAIRSKWSDQEMLKRSGQYIREPMTVPECSVRQYNIHQ